MKIDGGCHCGAIRFEAELDPARVGICHCTDCQNLSASAYRTVAMVDAADFRLTQGRPKEYIKTGDSGNRRIQAFCGDCGAALFAADANGNPLTFNIRAGAINQRAELVPTFECWRQSALPWLPELKDTAKFEKEPKP